MAFRRTPTTPEQPTVVDETVVSPAAQRVHEEYVTETPLLPPPSRGNEIWAWLLAAGFAILALAAGFWAWSQPDTNAVPTLVGLPAASAQTALQNQGFVAEVIRRPSDRPAGQVVAQAPEARAELEDGSRVAMIVSAGAAKVEVPKLVGLRIQAATRLLASLNLTPQPTVVASNQPQGTVLTQEPAAGEQVAPDTEVPLTVSKGPALIAVPALRGQNVDKATAQLEQLGLRPVVRTVASSEPENTVIAQSPAPGQKLKKGAAVTINSSGGEGDVTVPSVVGLDEADAVTALQDAGLKARILSVASGEPEGTVLRQTPAENGTVAKGATITIYTSDGSAAEDESITP
jgi:serine/threonine-protein kinase